jgi:hypothetical protein
MAMPEWYLVVAAAGALSVLGAFWPPLLFVGLPVAIAGLALPVVQAWRRTRRTRFTSAVSGTQRFRRRIVTTWLHLTQPLARLYGRMTHGLTPWRHHAVGPHVVPVPGAHRHWREGWRSHETTVRGMEDWLGEAGAHVRRGSGYDRWDLEVRAGGLGAARLLVATEEHGGGRQLVRVRWWPRPSWAGVVLCLAFIAATAAAAAAEAWIVWAALGVTGLAIGIAIARQCAAASGAIKSAVKAMR